MVIPATEVKEVVQVEDRQERISPDKVVEAILAEEGIRHVEVQAEFAQAEGRISSHGTHQNGIGMDAARKDREINQKEKRVHNTEAGDGSDREE